MQKTTILLIRHMDRIREVSIVVAGILLFALFIHNGWPLCLVAYSGMTGAALMIGYSTRHTPLLQTFGLSPVSTRTLLYCIPAILLGMGMGMLTRNTYDLSPLPGTVASFAFIAPFIGATEELIFRGYIQGYLRPTGRIFPVLYASTVHTSYKLLVILSLSIPLQFDLFFLVLWTFMGGLVFGTLRELAHSCIPPVIAHAIFDIVFYGAMAAAPLWVWS